MSTENCARRAIKLLLVEDNPGDVRLTLEAFKEAHLLVEVHVARDGVEAMGFLQRKSEYVDVPRPDLILLDLNLPKKNGTAVLAEIKADPSLQLIPVVVLTTSSRKEDIEAAYRLHANCLITKPLEMTEFIAFVRTLSDFWFSLVKLPSGALL